MKKSFVSRIHLLRKLGVHKLHFKMVKCLMKSKTLYFVKLYLVDQSRQRVPSGPMLLLRLLLVMFVIPGPLGTIYLPWTTWYPLPTLNHSQKNSLCCASGGGRVVRCNLLRCASLEVHISLTHSPCKGSKLILIFSHTGGKYT